MVDPAGVEPASAIVLKSSHSQVCLIYYHKLEKIDGFSLRLPSCCAPPVSRATILIFYFCRISTCYSILGNKVIENPTTMQLKLQRGSDYCYLQLSFWYRILGLLYRMTTCTIVLRYHVEAITGPLRLVWFKWNFYKRCSIIL